MYCVLIVFLSLLSVYYCKFSSYHMPTCFEKWDSLYKKLFQCLPVYQRSAQCKALIQFRILSFMSNKLHYLGFLINIWSCDLDKIWWRHELNKMVTYWNNCLSNYFLPKILILQWRFQSRTCVGTINNVMWLCLH